MGSTALYLGAQAIRGGLADCVIALGFEKMKPGSLGSTYDDGAQPMDKHIMAMAEISEVLFPPAPWMFGAADKHVLAGQATEIVGQAMTTDFANSFDGACKGLIGYHMNVAAAQRVCDQSGLGPQDFQVIELHDCFSANELLQGSAQTEAAQFDADPQAAPRPNPTRAPPRHFARSTYRDKVDLITRPAGMPPT